MKKPLRLALVGPCTSGKSTLAPVLEQIGYEVRQVAQEHSYVPNMWQRLSKPDILIYLDVDYATARARRPYTDDGPQRLTQQRQRLQHARQHCDFYLDTSHLTPTQVQGQVLDFLQEIGERQTDNG
jgi:shikimate kinase